jgi:hypothetical protein
MNISTRMLLPGHNFGGTVSATAPAQFPAIRISIAIISAIGAIPEAGAM